MSRVGERVRVPGDPAGRPYRWPRPEEAQEGISNLRLEISEQESGAGLKAALQMARRRASGPGGFAKRLAGGL